MPTEFEFKLHPNRIPPMIANNRFIWYHLPIENTEKMRIKNTTLEVNCYWEKAERVKLV